jgi:hypothetical protein
VHEGVVVPQLNEGHYDHDDDHCHQWGRQPHEAPNIEVAKVEPTGIATVGEQNGSDDEAREGEEEFDPDPATGQEFHTQVRAKDGEKGQSPQAVE